MMAQKKISHTFAIIWCLLSYQLLADRGDTRKDDMGPSAGSSRHGHRAQRKTHVKDVQPVHVVASFLDTHKSEAKVEQNHTRSAEKVSRREDGCPSIGVRCDDGTLVFVKRTAYGQNDPRRGPKEGPADPESPLNAIKERLDQVNRKCKVQIQTTDGKHIHTEEYQEGTWWLEGSHKAVLKKDEEIEPPGLGSFPIRRLSSKVKNLAEYTFETRKFPGSWIVALSELPGVCKEHGGIKVRKVTASLNVYRSSVVWFLDKEKQRKHADKMFFGEGLMDRLWKEDKYMAVEDQGDPVPVPQDENNEHRDFKEPGGSQGSGSFFQTEERQERLQENATRLTSYACPSICAKCANGHLFLLVRARQDYRHFGKNAPNKVEFPKEDTRLEKVSEERQPKDYNNCKVTSAHWKSADGSRWFSSLGGHGGAYSKRIFKAYPRDVCEQDREDYGYGCFPTRGSDPFNVGGSELIAVDSYADTCKAYGGLKAEKVGPLYTYQKSFMYIGKQNTDEDSQRICAENIEKSEVNGQIPQERRDNIYNNNNDDKEPQANVYNQNEYNSQANVYNQSEYNSQVFKGDRREPLFNRNHQDLAGMQRPNAGNMRKPLLYLFAVILGHSMQAVA